MTVQVTKSTKPEKANECIVEESFLVVLDSRNASQILNGSKNSSVIFNFAQSLTEQKDVIQISSCVVYFICPNSFYQINYTNCTLNILLSYLPFTITMPYGNYTVANFITTLVPLLPSSFSISFNSITSRLTITHTKYDFTLVAASSTINEIMGFGSTNCNSTSFSLTLPYMCNFSGLNSFNIHLDNISTKNIDSFSKTNGAIIASIPVNAPVGGVIIYEKKNSFDFDIEYDNLDYLQIDLMDDLENYLDLNNSHWNLTLQFTKKYEKTFRYDDGFFDILGNPYPKFLRRDDINDQEEETNMQL